MKSKIIHTIFFLFILFLKMDGQNILPTPTKFERTASSFVFKRHMTLAYRQNEYKTGKYLEKRLKEYIHIIHSESNKGDIILSLEQNLLDIGNEGYLLNIDHHMIKIRANSETGLFYGIQSLLQMLPEEVQAQKAFKLNGFILAGAEIKDMPKYGWRSFMLDSGRQFQSPKFIKRYLNYMALLKMNVFHWHLTEGQGWRIEIEKYPRLTEIGSRVAKGEEQQGYYTQKDIREIVSYAKDLHIMVVPEIDVPGHSEAALIAYPEMTCFNIPPKSVMGFSSDLFCAGKEATYTFIENILDEICELFPSNYIHLGGDEAPKSNWDQCPLCQSKIKEVGLKNSHDLQRYFSLRLAEYLKAKGKSVIFWGDVVYNEGTSLPDNVIIQWWNYRGFKDLALKNAIKRGHRVICNTNEFTYLNYPVVPWSNYSEKRTFDMKSAYLDNPCDLANPHELVLGMGASLWTDWHVLENMVDQRVFPRIFALAEQMWHIGDRMSYEDFYDVVKSKYQLMQRLHIDYGPTSRQDIQEYYKWE